MRCWLSVLLLSMLVCSCSKDSSSDDVILIVINGEKVTASEVREAVLFEQQIKEATGKPIPEKNVKKWRNSTAFRMMPGEFARVLLTQWFEKSDVGRSEEAANVVLKRYNQRLRTKCTTTQELISSFTGNRDFLEKRIAYETLLESYYQSISNDLKVCDEELELRIQQERDHTVKLQTLNSNAWAKAEACYHELKSGVKWTEAAAKYSEDKLVSSNNLEFAEDWMSYPVKGNTIDPEIVEALGKLEIGEFTRPIDTDYGLLIVRLTERDDSVMGCSRILFRLADVATDEPDPEAQRKQMEREALNQHMAALVQRLFKEAAIEYPMGETITYEVF